MKGLFSTDGATSSQLLVVNATQVIGVRVVVVGMGRAQLAL